MNATQQIVRIVSIRDTRAFEDAEGGPRPIPGSGDARQCDRCGRLHEIHAVVELTDGTRQTVGTGCMRGESPEFARALQSGARAATTRAKNRAIVRKLIAELRVVNACQTLAACTLTPEPVDATSKYNACDLLVARGLVRIDGADVLIEADAVIPGTTYSSRTPRAEALAMLRMDWVARVARVAREARGVSGWRLPEQVRGELRRALRKR